MDKQNKFEPQRNSSTVSMNYANLEQVVAWYHAAAADYPMKATWIQAINSGFYATWPLLTAKAVKKHFPSMNLLVENVKIIQCPGLFIMVIGFKWLYLHDK